MEFLEICFVAELFQAVAGLLADSRSVVEIARDEAANYRANYSQPIPLKVRPCSLPLQLGSSRNRAPGAN